jgi:RNA polymerase sigma factor (sigma-70 family)
MVTRYLGAQHLQLAEDVVQDALVRAMEVWPFTGIPDDPAAWILQTARRRALDHLRRRSRWTRKQEQLAHELDLGLTAAASQNAPDFDDAIIDSQLRMMLVCCHPALTTESQIGLILKILCGFGQAEIASAFLTTEGAIVKRLSRARQTLRDVRATMDLPSPAELSPRINTVRQALYLLFNEGYKASLGSSLLREEFCAEAIRLGELLAQVFPTDSATRALLALMCFNAARLSARTDAMGDILILDEQDRTKWDSRRLARGFEHLAASASGSEVTGYHLEAGIAACHSIAASAAETDWAKILSLYDELVTRDPSPIVQLNRAVALARVQGARAGLKALDQIANQEALLEYPFFHAVAGQLWSEIGDIENSCRALKRAIDLATLPAEKALLRKRLALSSRRPK